MSKKVINSEKAPVAIGPYSHSIDAGMGLIFTSGQIPIDPKTGELINGGIEEQTEQVIKNLSEVLISSNSSLENIVKTTIYLKDLNDFIKVNQVYGKYFAKESPARSTVEVSRLPKDALIEIEAIALSENYK